MTGTAELTAPASTPDSTLISTAYAQHGKALLRYVLGRTGGDRQLAEEVVQETMLRFWRHADQIDVDRAMRPWLFTVAKRVAIDRFRRRSARPDEVDMAELDLVPALDELDRRLTAHVVTQAVRALSPPHREVIMEIYFRGRRMVDIAEIHQLPLGTVKSRIYYALRALRTQLEERGVTSAP